MAFAQTPTAATSPPGIKIFTKKPVALTCRIRMDHGIFA